MRCFRRGFLSVLRLACNLVFIFSGQSRDLFNVAGSDHVVELVHSGVVLRPVSRNAAKLDFRSSCRDADYETCLACPKVPTNFGGDE